jgi:hypothetical protein
MGKGKALTALGVNNSFHHMQKHPRGRAARRPAAGNRRNRSAAGNKILQPGTSAGLEGH